MNAQHKLVGIECLDFENNRIEGVRLKEATNYGIGINPDTLPEGTKSVRLLWEEPAPAVTVKVVA